MSPTRMMDDALSVAREAVHCGEAPIGVVLYSSDGQRLAQGWNQRRSTGDISRHGELVAFGALAQPGLPAPEGMTLVTTLEPCVMCWGACLELKVARVIYGLEAPSNGGPNRVKDARQPQVIGGVQRNECRQLFCDWLAEHPGDAGEEYVRELLSATDCPST